MSYIFLLFFQKGGSWTAILSPEPFIPVSRPLTLMLTLPLCASTKNIS